MIELTVDAIKDYQTCALLYDYRHQQRRIETITSRDLLKDRYNNTIRKIVSFFFYKMQSGTVPSYSALVNRWEKHWFPKEMTPYDLIVEQHESAHKNLASYSTHAMHVLGKFYEDFIDHPSDPAYISEPFIVPIGKEIKLSGTFDLGLRNPKTKEYQIIKLSTSQRAPRLGGLFLDFAALKHAFDHRHEGKDARVSYYLYDIGSSNVGMNEVEVPDIDVNALFFWAKSAAEAEVYPPRRGLTSYCRSCPFDDPCSNWKDWPNDGQPLSEIGLHIQ